MGVPAEKRHKHAVVRTRDGEDKFPIYNERTARSALRLINRAKPPLTAAQKAAVKRKAAKYGVKPTED